MNTEKFNLVLENRINSIRLVLASKNQQYARDEVLSNFKKAALLQHCSPEKALLGMMTKHIIAIVDFIEDIDNGVAQPYGRWDEKIGDTINYLILLESLILEWEGNDSFIPKIMSITGVATTLLNCGDPNGTSCTTIKDTDNITPTKAGYAPQPLKQENFEKGIDKRV